MGKKNAIAAFPPNLSLEEFLLRPYVLAVFPVLGGTEIRVHNVCARRAAIQKQRTIDPWLVTMGHPLGIYSVDFFRKRDGLSPRGRRSEEFPKGPDR